MSGKWGGSQLPTPRAVRRHHGPKGGAAQVCGERHPFRKNKEGLLLQCDRKPDHNVQHHAKTKAGDVWW